LIQYTGGNLESCGDDEFAHGIGLLAWLRDVLTERRCRKPTSGNEQAPQGFAETEVHISSAESRLRDLLILASHHAAREKLSSMATSRRVLNNVPTRNSNNSN
jgi:hypothetical protein